ncbi:DUF3109 family protein [Porphyromonas sp. COT-108 OH1349]|uniref:DUF3109 family protein n=1 Tax=Porphyromonas sp. COT-108 OH1349 TaxID=1537504 RepID=UPI00052DA313|nr:DUF3109 family protein [Porphyromonas sp. COT-108 OH1349]KGN70566.1 hypothetical protein JT26_03670 [Porphyromonas sp. COT-108 OH1349]
MIEIDGAIVSRDVIETYFCCDLEACKGACCIEGESGAPLEENELPKIAECYDVVREYLPEKHLNYLEQNGPAYRDSDGDLVTSIIGGRDCVFSLSEENGWCRCAFEKAYTENKQRSFYKPVSCHLYPVRLTEYSSFTAVNYHEWEICKPALVKGKKLNMRVYQFLKEPLIRRFGKEWYDKLEEIAGEMLNTSHKETHR